MVKEKATFISIDKVFCIKNKVKEKATIPLKNPRRGRLRDENPMTLALAGLYFVGMGPVNSKYPSKIRG